MSEGPGQLVFVSERSDEDAQHRLELHRRTESSWQKPRIPKFAGELDANIAQLHVADYRNPGQIEDGSVLIVGAGSSGAELAKELARTHDV